MVDASSGRVKRSHLSIIKHVSCLRVSILVRTLLSANFVRNWETSFLFVDSGYSGKQRCKGSWRPLHCCEILCNGKSPIKGYPPNVAQAVLNSSIYPIASCVNAEE